MAASLLLDDLRAALGPDAVLTDPDLLRGYERDEADLCASGTPVVVTRPRSTEEVAAVVRAAGRYGVPVVPQGARTGLAGAANAVDGAVVLSTTAMDAILEIDPVSRIAVVQPGVVNAALTAAVAEHGLWYPPDPGSWESSTIGGNVATNAGGMCCVKYGVTTEYVLGLEVVLASGEVLRTGRRTAKGVAGYDLTRLFVGSEGTLGVITEVTVALRPAPAASLTLVAVFGSTGAAGEAVARIAAQGLSPSLLELLDRTHLVAIEAYRPMGLRTDAEALLLAAADTGPRAAEDLAELAAVCTAAGAEEVYAATDAAEAAALLQARRLAHPAMEKYAADTYPGGNGGLIIDDLAVPRGALAALLDGVARIAAECAVPIGVVGHAGDGNMHPNIVVDRNDPASLERGRRAFDEIMRLGLELGGTCTGEHGVGLLKRDWLAREIGPVGVRVHQAIKNALDPAGLLNPGKVL
ncbi:MULTISPECIES: FAD-binding oxidoreductase [Micromonospora]|uniref:FAD-linked oxidase n=2 Tax=Micromonospora TaxID=1873 RepID=A0A9X0LDZ4_9ACTN|nr:MULTISPECIES: FAD-linked oxidase C-terminal domain-containing protein [Micromonospora]AEB47530.1 fad linked oxidase domain protein [Micromonospora maris AB-18-032]KUJ46586.1 FAD-linked oxidase [Micromonospora maris]MBL6278567.1 FAD-binding protein [Micromonospora fiedleri]RUL93858.1 FAD-binding protein [Verrucosispora sp. FIM060022]WSK42808.1 FAD-binding protein [Micromonospora maris]